VTYVNSTTVTLSQTATNGTGLTINLYRSGKCGSAQWDSFQSTVDDPNASTDVNGERVTLLGLARWLEKPMIIDEVGSHPGCAGSSDYTNGCFGNTFSRGDWFDAMYNYLNTDESAQHYIIGYAYYHTTLTFDWRFINTATGIDTRGYSNYAADFGSDSNYLSDTSNYVLHPIY
jgi:hypothetical protein